MPTDLIQTFLIVLTLLLGVLAVEAQNMLHAVVFLCGMCITIGMLFGFLNAPYVMAFQLLIYAGATVVLFISVIMLTKVKEE